MPAQQFTNFAEGTLLANINDTTTTITSTTFAALPVISGGDTLILVIDPEEADGTVEIVTVTAHTASSTSVTATRGQQGTTASAHTTAAVWIAPVTAVTLQEWEDHVDSVANPHGVTAAQAGAVPTADLTAHKAAGGNTQHPDATGSVSGFMTAADFTKLAGIETAAKDDQTFTAGGAITITGAPNPTIAHTDTSTQASVANAIGTVIEDITLDTYGHITAIGSRNLSPADIGADNQDVGFVHGEITDLPSSVAEQAHDLVTVGGLTSGKTYLYMMTGGVSLNSNAAGQVLNVRCSGPDGSGFLMRQEASAAGEYISATASHSGSFVASGTTQAFNLLAWTSTGGGTDPSSNADVICIQHP